MAKYKIRMSEAAKEDMKEIAAYITSQQSSTTASVKTIRKLREALTSISISPLGFPSVIHRRLPEGTLRKAMVKKHIVFFTVNEKDKIVDVARILHSRRNWVDML